MNIKNNTYVPQIVFHPGETLKEKLQEMNINPKDFARSIKLPENVVIDFIHGDISLNRKLAIEFEKFTGIPVKIWLKSQEEYDKYYGNNKVAEPIVDYNIAFA